MHFQRVKKLGLPFSLLLIQGSLSPPRIFSLGCKLMLLDCRGGGGGSGSGQMTSAAADYVYNTNVLIQINIF
jgi:hypothetical protein